MSHVALARKYRPRRFGEVSTQEHVSQTLCRAVATDRVGHAYLFCGPRGVGKTTLARVLAMSLNCPSRGSDGEPCGECDSCSRIWAGHTSLDVVEIDAASNRGVDDARDLRERAMYAPSEEGRFKVYILDEAHMLTREAWNALLKIIEEPPPRVIFIFATTEPQKIQQTAAPILSRCQRFDFRRIGAADIVARLTHILELEGITASPDVLRAIARKANGGMRDGLSLLDQVLSLSDGVLTIETVVRVLGVVDEERYLELFDLLVDRNHGGVFGFVERLLDEGYDLVEFYHGLAEKVRLLLRLVLEPGTLPPDLSVDMKDDFLRRAQMFSAGDLVRMLSMTSDLESSGSLRRTGRPRILIEMLLLRMSYLDQTVELEDIVAALGGSDRGPSTPRAVPANSSPGSSAPSDPAKSATPPTAPAKTAPVVTAPVVTAPVVTAPVVTAPTDESPNIEPAPGDLELHAEVPPPSVRPTAPSGSPPPPRESASPAQTSQGSSMGLVAAWNKILNEGTGIPQGLRPFLRAARVEEHGDTLQIKLTQGPGVDRLRDPIVVRGLTDTLGLYSGRPSVEISLEGGHTSPVEASGARVTEHTVRENKLQQLIDREPQLQKAVDELDLELMD